MKNAIIDEEFLNQVELLEMCVHDNVAGLFGGTHKTKAYGSSCEFADNREYVPGDDIRRIDWNIFARYDRLFMRLYLDERQMHTRIYIDGSKSMEYGEVSKGEFALKLASIFAYFSVKAMDKVSIYYIRGKKCYEIVKGIVGKDAYFNAIGALNDVKFKGDSSFTEAIIPTSVGYGDGVSILISDFLTENDYQGCINYLREKRRDVLVLQILCQEEVDPKFKNKALFYDSENSNKTFKKNISKDVLKAYQEALKYVTKRLEDYCVARDANYLLVSTGDRLEDIMMDKLIRKEVLK